MIEVPLPDMPDGPSPEEVINRGLLKRYLQLAVQAHEISIEVEAIKTRFRALGPGVHDLGIGTITVQPQKRFDADTAADVLRKISPDLVTTCSRSFVAADLVKKVVGDDIYEQCQKPVGEHKVSVK